MNTGFIISCYDHNKKIIGSWNTLVKASRAMDMSTYLISSHIENKTMDYKRRYWKIKYRDPSQKLKSLIKHNEKKYK